MNYSVFDEFCRRPTWNTGHKSDLLVFSAALRVANRQPDFSPAEMVEYIRKNGSDGIWPISDTKLNLVLSDLCHRAQAAKKRSSR